MSTLDKPITPDTPFEDLPEHLELKQMAAYFNMPSATLSEYLRPEIRALMDQVGSSGRFKYHKRYAPALVELFAQRDDKGRYAIKPTAATIFLRERFERINDGAEMPVPGAGSGIAIHDSRSAHPNNRLTVAIPDNAGEMFQELTLAMKHLASGAMATTEDRLLTLEQAHAYGIPKGTLRRNLPKYLVGRQNMWKLSDVQRYIRDIKPS